MSNINKIVLEDEGPPLVSPLQLPGINLQQLVLQHWKEQQQSGFRERRIRRKECKELAEADLVLPLGHHPGRQVC